jgi:hypothetical protein
MKFTLGMARIAGAFAIKSCHHPHTDSARLNPIGSGDQGLLRAAGDRLKLYPVQGYDESEDEIEH